MGGVVFKRYELFFPYKPLHQMFAFAIFSFHKNLVHHYLELRLGIP